MLSFSLSARVAVKDLEAFEVGFTDIHHRVMYNTLRKGRSADDPLLGIFNGEIGIGSDSRSLVFKSSSYLFQITIYFHPEQKMITLHPLSPGGFPVGKPNI